VLLWVYPHNEIYLGRSSLGLEVGIGASEHLWVGEEVTGTFTGLMTFTSSSSAFWRTFETKYSTKIGGERQTETGKQNCHNTNAAGKKTLS